MPHVITQFYRLTGYESVLIYSEQEMADALGVSRSHLRSAISKGYLLYHAHPNSNALKEYQFTAKTYEENQQRFACIQGGGHFFEFDHYYDELLKKACYRCRNCPAERYD